MNDDLSQFDGAPPQIPPESQGSAPTPEPAVDSYIEKLISGDLGLAVTYWVYGVLAGFVWAAAMAAAKPEHSYQKDGNLQDILKYSFLGYYFLIYIAIWNAAGKYKGQKAWAVLAKFVVVLTCVPAAIQLIKNLE